MQVTVTEYINGEPRGAVELVDADGGVHAVGEALARNEQLWLASEINRHLEDRLGQAVAVADWEDDGGTDAGRDEPRKLGRYRGRGDRDGGYMGRWDE